MVKLKFGTYKNVLLTKSEYAKIVKLYDKETTNEYVEHLSDYIVKTGKTFLSHFDTIREWLTKDGYQKNERDEIYEVLRSKYHRVLCKCGKRMQFVGFDGEKVEGLVPSAFYKCSCGINAYEKVYTNQDMVVVYFGKDEKPSIATLHDLAEIELLAVNIEEMEKLLNEN